MDPNLATSCAHSGRSDVFLCSPLKSDPLPQEDFRTTLQSLEPRGVIFQSRSKISPRGRGSDFGGEETSAAPPPSGGLFRTAGLLTASGSFEPPGAPGASPSRGPNDRTSRQPKRTFEQDQPPKIRPPPPPRRILSAFGTSLPETHNPTKCIC